MLGLLYLSLHLLLSDSKTCDGSGYKCSYSMRVFNMSSKTLLKTFKGDMKQVIFYLSLESGINFKNLMSATLDILLHSMIGVLRLTR